MLEYVGNLRTSEVELRQPLSALERDWLTSCLNARNGVADVKWAGKMHRLCVEYDADVFGSSELIDFLRTLGVPVASLRAAYA